MYLFLVGKYFNIPLWMSPILGFLERCLDPNLESAGIATGAKRPTSNKKINIVLTDLVRFIFLEWILRMSSLASSFGGGNSIFLNCEENMEHANKEIHAREKKNAS